MREIARDETSHALLSWKLAAWFESQMNPRDRRRVRTAMRRAAASLRRDIKVSAMEPWANEMGFPTTDEADAIHAELAADLWL
ncbi:MAG: hypothetical protein ACREJX_05700 [Polyangiaceae bacterium]